MGKSFRHTSITGFSTAESDKSFKKYANRKTRRNVKRDLISALDNDNEELLDLLTDKDVRDYSNIYDAPKDGSQYIGNMNDDIAYKKLMRK